MIIIVASGSYFLDIATMGEDAAFYKLFVLGLGRKY